MKERKRSLGTGSPEQVELYFQMHLEVAGSDSQGKDAKWKAGEKPDSVNNFNLTNDVRKRRDCPSAD